MVLGRASRVFVGALSTSVLLLLQNPALAADPPQREAMCDFRLVVGLSRRRLQILFWGTSLVLFGLILLSKVHVHAEAPCGTSGMFTSPSTCTYSLTNVEDTFSVPAGVTSLHVVARGGNGGAGDNSGGSGGRGAVVTADIPTTPATTLYVDVGGNGAVVPADPVGGFNGGGHGGHGFYYWGGGGGGASDIRMVAGSLASRLLVAAGGGGGGATGYAWFCPGGAGGDSEAAGADGYPCASLSSTSGTGGTAGALTGGSGGSVAGSPGVLGVGGGGGGYFSGGGGYPGGGGGGGYYGGGGGGSETCCAYGAGGGAGGGSNFAIPTATGVSVAVNVAGAASITISWTSVATVDQTIDFAGLSDRLLIDSPVALSATASSGLPVSFSSLTPAVCTVSGTSATLVTTGICTVQADQPGDATDKAAPAVSQSFLVVHHFFTVNTTADAVDTNIGDGVCETAPGNAVCTLRAAIQEANASAGLDKITLPAGVYTLTISGAGEDGAATGDLDITDPVRIAGAGPKTTVIQGDSGGTFVDRIFDVWSGSSGITGVTIRYGYDPGAEADFYSHGGGGIRVESGASLMLDTTAVQGNTTVSAYASGGGIYSAGGLVITNSTISGNAAANAGGGITNWIGGSLTLSNVTISANNAFGGGGIYNVGGGSLNNVTIARNTGHHSGGIWSDTFHLATTNTIVAGNVGSFSVNCRVDNGGYLTSFGYNLFPAECGAAAGTDQVASDAFVLPLADNGGPTQTLELLSGSLAIDNGNPAPPGSGGYACAATDQRGAARLGTCDIGAYEFGVVLPDATVASNIHNAAHATVTSVVAGSVVHDSVDVTGGGPVPTGTVTLSWFANGSCAGSPAATSSALALTGGAVDATGFTQMPGAVGSYAFQAAYSGDGNYVPGTGPCETLSVNPANQATLTVTGPTSVTYGTTGTATATGGSGTGALTFDAGASTGCAVVATTVSVTDPSGTCVLTATKAADANYTLATSAPFTVTLNKASQATVTVTGPTSVTYGTTGTATATGGSGTGAYSFSAAGSTGCAVSGTAVSVSNASGTCTLTATRAGDNNYAASAASASFPVTLNKASQAAVTVTAPGAVTYGTTGIAAASGGSGTGVYGFSAAGSTGCAVSGTTVSVSNASGSCALTATRAGDSNYNASAASASFPVTLSKASQIITFAALANRKMNQSPFTVTATASSGLIVTFTTTTSTVCASGGTSGATITLLATGTCTVVANQTGNANYSAASNVAQSFTVGNGKADQTITFGALASKRLAQSPVTVSATASSGLTVQFTTTTPAVCTATKKNGVTIVLLAIGTCTVQADQPGGATYNPAPSVTQSFSVTP